MLRSIPFAAALLAVAAVASLTASAVARADVYRTVDAQGEVHYSDEWSPGAVLIKGDRSHATDAADDSSKPVTNDHTLAPDPAKQAAAKAVQADMDAVRAQQCKQLQEQYEKVIHARRIYENTPGANGERQYMTDAEADAERVKTKQAMDEACGTDTSS